MRDHVLPLKRYLDDKGDALRSIDTLQAALLHVRRVVGAIGDEFADNRMRCEKERTAFLEVTDIIARGIRVR